MKAYKRKDRIIFVIMAAILVLPYVMNIVYSLPSADDFSMAKNYDLSMNIFIESVRQAGSMYMKWTGEWFYSFIQTLINPLVIFGYSSRMFGIELAVLFLLFIGVIIFCTDRIAVYIFQCDKSLIIYAIQFIVLVIVLNTGIYSEIYPWFVGSSYMIEVTLSLVCITLILKYHESGDKWIAAVLSVLGFFTCNGIMVVSLICLAYLTIFFKDIIQGKKRFSALIPFIFCLAGGLFSVAAPGNYARHNSIDGTGLHIGSAVVNTFKVELSQIYSNLNNELIGMMLITIVVLSYFYARKHYEKIRCVSLIKAVLFFLAVMFFVIFPVTLGYSSSDMPNRMKFMINTYTVLGLGFLGADAGFCVGHHMGDRVIDERVGMLTALIVLIGFYVGPLSHGNIGLTPYAQQIINHSETVSCHDEWISILEEVESSKDADVIVNRQEIPACSLLRVPDLGDDINKWENTVTAAYFGKNSVQFVTEDG